MSVRAKMQCIKRSETANMGSKEAWGVEVMLQPVYAEDGPNKSWSTATPSGQVQMTITNPEAFKQFEIGKCYYVDFSPVE